MCLGMTFLAKRQIVFRGHSEVGRMANGPGKTRSGIVVSAVNESSEAGRTSSHLVGARANADYHRSTSKL